MGAELRKPEMLKTREPFKSLFPTPKAVWEAVFNDMRVRGYDPAFPIVTWDDTVIDGHTRLEVAKQLRKGVYVVEKGFASTKAALEYAVHCQRDRRNLTPEGLMKAVAAIDVEEMEKAEARQKELAGSRGKTLASRDAKVPTGKSSAATGKALGVSASQVERARAVNRPDTPQEIKDKVDKGEVSLEKGAELARQAKKGEKEDPRPKQPKFIGQLKRALDRGSEYLGVDVLPLYDDEVEEIRIQKGRLDGLYTQARSQRKER